MPVGLPAEQHVRNYSVHVAICLWSTLVHHLTENCNSLERVIERRVRDKVQIDGMQFGFRSGRGNK